ncbi:sugar-specific transcriptional regulator TrmB [Methanohalophilus levihalophilus]|uniref:coiled-coil domain-containing protein n=1 Tax=Methanohalophilus levihalophilus TaxID=1431282 RepID=UPI001AE48D79|nr:hypothetical protein [Methanohalophilus levihalophilus]MBP2029502.1 sugar-specific transcriptional regulator TrmB [Methanohalophilus levihalophilus]
MRTIEKSFVTLVVLALLLFQPIAVSALTAGEAKQAWYDAKEATLEAQEEHRDAKLAWAENKTDENNEKVIETGKDSLNAALDEAEAWLVWKNLEVEENPEIPEDLKETIQEDVDTNLAKIDDLRAEVDEVENRLELGIVFLKMVGSYLELVSDVARNSGFVWVHIADEHAGTLEEYESELRMIADDMDDNDEIIEKLDMAKSEIEDARENIDNAEEEYEQVRLPGTPLVMFSNGNNYLRIARGNMITAHGHLNEAYTLIVRGA